MMNTIFFIIYSSFVSSPGPIVTTLEGSTFHSLEACETAMMERYLVDGWQAERKSGRLFVYSNLYITTSFTCGSTTFLGVSD